MTDRSCRTVGVLFVHGIGEQKRGDTLISFAEPLYGWLSRWFAGTRGEAWSISALDAHVVGTTTEAPSNLRVRVERRDGTASTEIVMAESWWAESFSPPSYAEVARWALLVLPAVVGAYVRPRMRASQDAAARSEADMNELTVGEQIAAAVFPTLVLGLTLGVQILTRYVVPALLLFVGAFVLLVIQVALLSLLVLGVIPRIRKGVARLQLYVANGFGDTLTLLGRPMRYLAMLTQVRQDLVWLEERCDEVLVVAHSQGAVLVSQVIAERPGKVRDLVTLGGAITKVPTLRAAMDHAARAYVSLALRLAALVAVGYHFASAHSSLPNPEPWILPTAAVTLFYISALIDVPGSPPPEAAIDAVVPRVRAVEWCDIIGDADPVPEGPLPSSSGARTHVVQNTGSIARDHVTYLDNSEQVTSRIWSRILDPTPTRLPDTGTPDDERRIARARVARHERIDHHRVAPKLVLAADWVIVFAAVGIETTRAVGRWLITPAAWLLRVASDTAANAVRTDAFFQLSLGSAALLAALIALHLLIVTPRWLAWHRRAADWFFTGGDGEPPGPPVDYSIARAVLCLPMLSPIAAALLRGQPAFSFGAKFAALLWIVFSVTMIPYSGRWVSVSSVDKETAAVGDRVRLSGMNLKHVDVVRVGPRVAPIKRRRHDHIIVEVPPDSEGGRVVLEAGSAKIDVGWDLRIIPPLSDRRQQADIT